MATLSPADELPYRSLSPERGQSRVHGSGTVARVLSPHKASAPPHRDRSREELCPNPIDPDTSCRKLVTPRVGVTHDVGLSLSDAPVFSEPARQPPLDAAIASQGRLPRGPAKDQVLRCTRSVFHRRIRPVRGCALFLHNLSPACGVKGERLFNLRAAVTLTRLRTRPRTRLRGFGDGRKGRTRTRTRSASDNFCVRNNPRPGRYRDLKRPEAI
jgi:hypothetical protein